MRKKRQPNPGFMQPLQADEALAAVVGSEPLPRPQVVKSLWNGRLKGSGHLDPRAAQRRRP